MMCLTVQCSPVWACMCGVVMFCGRLKVGSWAWDMAMPAATASICPWGSVSPHLMVLLRVVWWSLEGQVLWSFLYSAREGGRMIAIWGFAVEHVAVVMDVVSCRCGDTSYESATRFWSYWKKKASDTGRRPLCPQDREGLRRDRGVNVLWRIHTRVAVHRHCVSNSKQVTQTLWKKG